MVAEIAERVLGLGEWAISTTISEALICFGLGSCVAIAVHDEEIPMAGMAHMVLPDSAAGRISELAPAKFVDLAVPLLIDRMVEGGAALNRLQVDLVGGAAVLRPPGALPGMNIGERNAAAAIAVTEALGLNIRSMYLGGTRGRTVRLAVATGALNVSTAGAKSECTSRTG